MEARADQTHHDTPFHRAGIQSLLLTIAVAGVLWLALRSTLQEPAIAPISANSPLLRVGLNSADARELSLLPAIGPTLAKRIVENRERLGPFRSLDDLGRVHGIGEKRIVGLQEYCCVNLPSEAVVLAATP